MASAIDALNSPGKRVKIMDAQTVVKLPAQVKTLIGEIAEKEGVSDATIVRRALGEYLTKRGYRA